MKLEKAIEINTIHNDHNPNFTDAEREEAHKLGINALIFYRKLKSLNTGEIQGNFLGETED